MSPKDPYWLVSRSCVKMLFKPAARRRLFLLMVAFMACIAVNTGNHLVDAARLGRRCRVLLQDPVFKLYFLRCRSATDLRRFLDDSQSRLHAVEGSVVRRGFVYQHQLYLPVLGGKSDRSMAVMRRIFGPDPRQLARSPLPLPEQGRFRLRATYFPLIPPPEGESEAVLERLRLDLQDITDQLRGDLSGRRLMIANDTRQRLVRTLGTGDLGRQRRLSPFFSRIASVVPMEILDLWSHWCSDRTTDIVDWHNSLQIDPDGTMTIPAGYLAPRPLDTRRPAFWQLDIYPRYIPLWLPEIVTVRRGPLMAASLRLQDDAVAFLKQAHTDGHYLLSFEKLHVLESQVSHLNNDRRVRQVAFIALDLVMSVVFAFMMSLFAFVHLKTELAFLLMFRNAIGSILRTFWLLPIVLTASVKIGALAAYALSGLPPPPGGMAAIGIPMALTLGAAAVLCWPLNRWCFRQLTSNRIELYRLHRDA